MEFCKIDDDKGTQISVTGEVTKEFFGTKIEFSVFHLGKIFSFSIEGFKSRQIEAFGEALIVASQEMRKFIKENGLTEFDTEDSE